jgi:hypothetical protein
MLIFLLISIILVQASGISFLIYNMRIVQDKLDEQRTINELNIINGNKEEEFIDFHEYSKEFERTQKKSEDERREEYE